MLSWVESGSLVLNFIPRPAGGEVYFVTKIVTNHNPCPGKDEPENIGANEWRKVREPESGGQFIVAEGHFLLGSLIRGWIE